jgi:hypothetical protein
MRAWVGACVRVFGGGGSTKRAAATAQSGAEGLLVMVAIAPHVIVEGDPPQLSHTTPAAKTPLSQAHIPELSPSDLCANILIAAFGLRRWLAHWSTHLAVATTHQW